MLMSYSSDKENMNLFDYLDILSSIDIEYVEDLVKRLIKEENISLSTVYPS